MYCTKKITEDLFWVGANDRRLAMFEGVYSVPYGVSYNSYLLLDEETVLFDTVDKAVSSRFFENIEELLGERKLNYLIVQHMEPDHSATMLSLMKKYPDMYVVLNEKTLKMVNQFFENSDIDDRAIIVKEGDKLPVGKHTLTFLMAPMVHWPEVMVTYDITDKILFSADGFGSFGALNGAIFADEADFETEYVDEARRYYTNIVGKYGNQVQSLLKKASNVEINMICPLHGLVWRNNIDKILNKYILWSTYTPEINGVMIAYASIYGNTENAAEILACKLRESGIKTIMYDVSVTPASEIISASFKYSHLVFASTTYNAGIFVSMEALINDIVSHNLQNRKIALIENGSWAPASKSLMHQSLSKCKNMTFFENTLTLNSSLKRDQLDTLTELAKEIASSFTAQSELQLQNDSIDNTAIFKISYGLFVLTAKDGEKDNGCIINTAQLVTDSPKRISVTVNKANYTCDMIKKTGIFNISVLSTDAHFDLIKQFGFSSGKDVNKFEGQVSYRAENGVTYIDKQTNAYISGKVINEVDCGSHIIFIAEVTEAVTFSNTPSMTYSYYLENVKPKPKQTEQKKNGFVCRICGYIYEGDELPEDFICPLCKHGAEDFEKL